MYSSYILKKQNEPRKSKNGGEPYRLDKFAILY